MIVPKNLKGNIEEKNLCYGACEEATEHPRQLVKSHFEDMKFITSVLRFQRKKEMRTQQ